MTPEEIRRRTFVLDTKSSCFLCLREIFFPGNCNGDGKTDSFTDIHGDRKRFSLRSILLYLKINPGNVFSCLNKGSSSSLIADTAKMLEKMTNFSVTLCEECGEVSNQLSEVCRELELIQFKVENYLESFFELLAFSQSDEDQLARFLEKMTGPLHSVQRSIAEILRNQTMAKCRRILNQAQPRVYLRQANQGKQLEIPDREPLPEPACEFEPVITSTQTLAQSLQLPLQPKSLSLAHTEPSVSLYKQICDPCGGKFSSKEKWINHLKMNCFLSGAPLKKSSSPGLSVFKHLKRTRPQPNGGLISKVPLVLPKPASTSAESTICLSPSSLQPDLSNNVEIICTHCSQRILLSDHQYHQIQHHPEKIFIASKQSKLSLDLFKRCCEYVLHREILSIRLMKTASRNVTYESSYCSACSINVFDSKVMHIHLVKIHKKIIVDKLVETQEMLDLKELNEECRGRLDENLKCMTCGTIFSRDFTLNKHVKLCGIPNKDIHSSSPLPSPSTPSFDLQETSMSSNYSNSNVSFTGNTPCEPIVQSEPVLIQCKTCCLTFTRPKDLLRHKILVHRDGNKTTQEKKAKKVKSAATVDNWLLDMAPEPEHNTFEATEVFSNFGAAAKTKIEFLNNVEEEREDVDDDDMLTITNESMMILDPDSDPLQI